MSDTKPNMPAVSGSLRPYPVDGTPEQQDLAIREALGCYAHVAQVATQEVPKLREAQEETNRLLAFSNAQKKRIELALTDIRKEQVDQRTDIARLTGRVGELSVRVDELDAHVGTLESRTLLRPIASLPPPRAASGSSHDLEAKASSEIAKAVVADIKDPRTPQPTVETVAALIEPRVATTVDQVKAQQWERYQASLVEIDEQRRQAELEAEKAKTKAALDLKHLEDQAALDAKVADAAAKRNRRNAVWALCIGGGWTLYELVKAFLPRHL